MLPRLIILSDLWGKQKSDWVRLYEDKLTGIFDIQYYDCCDLGNIDISTYSQEDLHRQFITFGIETAVQKLIQLEKQPFHVLSFSIGGIIAWKAALLGLPLISFHAVSATRLRYENTILAIPIQLYFGMNDRYKPSQGWNTLIGSENIQLCNNEAHEMYRKEKIADVVCKKIIQRIQYS
ncbi:alpha/beta hydrolase [uncultured Kordia sp.]|uniref:alpha/beta hydrolase n=1 Tax=uncultured Kordia sp. TaxID=507699 RepID=UPI00262AD087|nr:alpha/beta hydrolase [uncultured Kordia sp.]